MDCYMQHGSVGTHPPKHPSMHVHITPTHTHSNHLSAFGGTSNFFIHMNLSRAKPHVSSNASRLAACSLSLLSDPCTTTPVTSGELHGRLRRRMPCHFVSYHPNLETEAIRERRHSRIADKRLCNDWSLVSAAIESRRSSEQSRSATGGTPRPSAHRFSAHRIQCPREEKSVPFAILTTAASRPRHLLTPPVTLWRCFERPAPGRPWGVRAGPTPGRGCHPLPHPTPLPPTLPADRRTARALLDSYKPYMTHPRSGQHTAQAILLR